MVATTILTILIFLVIYLVVFNTSYSHLNNDLRGESEEVINSFVILSDQIIFAGSKEWNETEHDQIEVNPIFFQLSDTLGHVIKKTRNLRNGTLAVKTELSGEDYFNTYLSNSPIRQLQVPIHNHVGKLLGYLSIAVPLKETRLMLKNLRIVFLLSLPFVLIALYYFTLFTAQRSIRPIIDLTTLAEKITQKNLDERIPLPQHQDELYRLTATLNDLLNRLQEAILREKQFTSDASHELRTPLSVLKGTFEVMLRRPRNDEYYKDKVRIGLSEVNRMSVLVDQLLFLARYENKNEPVYYEELDPRIEIHEIIVRLRQQLVEKNVDVQVVNHHDLLIITDKLMVEQILENLLTNAIKFSPQGKTITIGVDLEQKKPVISVSDQGRGMPPATLQRIFERFYRADQSRNSSIKGNGLGLAIVKRFADILKIEVRVESTADKGTTFWLVFPEKD